MNGGTNPDSTTVTVRVQVIDLNSFTLDLQVPTYLPARDLTQRIARDAGLEAHWSDGRRRLYWLRARGRLLDDSERLAELGVIDGELVYLLPEPPANSGVVEQAPDYPKNQGYAGKGTIALMASGAGVLVWSTGWGIALSEVRNQWTVVLPGIALGLMCATFARHAWGGTGNRPRVAITAIVALIPAALWTLTLGTLLGIDPFRTVYTETVGGLIFSFVGVMVGWLAWWGAVEPLDDSLLGGEEAAAEEAVAVVQCAICGLDVKSDVRTECPYACGRYFHSGCYRARLSVYRGEPTQCAICNVQIA